VKYRQLGATNIQISEIGFGAWGIGGKTQGATSYGETDDNISREALLKAFERGVNFFDTSNLYGDGHSESLIGKIFKNSREQVIIATKAGMLAYNVAPDFSNHNIQLSLDRSLSRLQTDYVDLFQLHNPTKDILRFPDRISPLIEQLKLKEKIRAFGISVNSPEEGLLVLKNFELESLQVNFNILDQRVIDMDLLSLAQDASVSIIARTPLCFGFLAGIVDAKTQLSENDHRSRWPKDKIEAWSKDGLSAWECADRSEMQTRVQFALRFCLSFSQVTSVIPGMLTSHEVLENIKASDLGSLTDKELNCVYKIYQQHNRRMNKY